MLQVASLEVISCYVRSSFIFSALIARYLQTPGYHWDSSRILSRCIFLFYTISISDDKTISFSVHIHLHSFFLFSGLCLTCSSNIALASPSAGWRDPVSLSPSLSLQTGHSVGLNSLIIPYKFQVTSKRR